MVFKFEKKDKSFFIIPGCTPEYRLDKYIQDSTSFSQISHLSIVIPQRPFYLDTIESFLRDVACLRHLHLDIPELDEPFESELHSVIETALLNNGDTLESIALNCCSNGIMEYMRSLPKLKVLVLTVTDTFNVTKYNFRRVGGWPSLEVVVVNLQCLEQHRARFVDIFVCCEFPVLTSFAILGSPPFLPVQHLLAAHQNDIRRISLITPNEHYPFNIPYDFVLPYMPNLTELSFSYPHHKRFNKNVQPSVKKLIIHDEEQPVESLLNQHKGFVHKLSRDTAFPTLECIILRSTVHSSFETTHNVSGN